MMRLLTGITLTLFAATLSVPADPPREPIRVLVLLGGDYHPYEEASKILIDAANRTFPIKAAFFRLDNPPAGKPDVEKASMESRPAILRDPYLGRKFDVILAYHQKSWVDLAEEEAAGYLDFVRGGGGLVAVHSACDPITSHPEYVTMLGARFVSHEPYGEITVEKAPEAPAAPVLDGVADRFHIEDEFYYLEEPEGVDKQVLLTAQSEDGKTRPVAWKKAYGKGRVVCTILGHNEASHRNPNVQWLVRNAIVWAAGRSDKHRFVPLFDGETLDGWRMMAEGGFRVENGVMTSYGGMGLLWYSRQRFRDFVLLMEWKVNKKSANSGIFLRIPDPPEDFWQAVNTGYEVQIADTNPPKHNTGSIFDFQAPTKVATRPPGQWNVFEITVIGHEYTVVLNGEVVNEFTGQRALQGYLGVQNHDPDSIIQIRRMEIKELREPL